jgi:hypothetical protein
MNSHSKTLTLLLIALLAVSAFATIRPASAQTFKPAIPEFTVKRVSYPYDVPPVTTTTIDQYTGKEIVTTQPGYNVENKSIEVTIKNQHYTPYTDENGTEHNIFYSVRVKGHFTDTWKELYSPYECPTRDGPSGAAQKSPAQSNSEYTILSLSADYPDGAQVDFQVRAFEGYYIQYYPYMAVAAYIWVFRGQFSDWSQTQTITIHGNTSTTTTGTTPNQPTPTLTETTATPSSTPYSTPTVALASPQNQEASGANSAITQTATNNIEAIAFAAVAVIVAVLLVVIMFMRRRMQVLERRIGN